MTPALLSLLRDSRSALLASSSLCRQLAAEDPADRRRTVELGKHATALAGRITEVLRDHPETEGTE